MNVNNESIGVNKSLLKAEERYSKAKAVIDDLGYNTVQEAIVDLMTEGLYDKDENTWTEITEASEIQTNRNHMNLAQAKYYGLEIIRAEPKSGKLDKQDNMSH